MMKKTMILADHDELYLNRLSDYLMEKAPQLDLMVFTGEDAFHNWLMQNRQIDILAVDEGFAAGQAAACIQAGVKLVLSGSMTPVEGFEVLKKYQKTETLLNEIFLKYAEHTGSSEVIKGKSCTKTAVFYSPAGGTGKTTLALGLAAACARAGLHSFYLNLEEIDSVREALAATLGSLSDIFLAVKTKGMNVGVKLAACVGKERDGGFYYLSGVDSISEYEEMTGDDMTRLIEAIKDLAEYDVLIIDLSSGFSEKTVKTLEQADVIFSPIMLKDGMKAKLKRFFGEGELHGMYHSIFQKICLVLNCAGNSDGGEWLLRSGLSEQAECCGAVGNIPVFGRAEGVIRGGEELSWIFAPLLRRLTEEG